MADTKPGRSLTFDEFKWLRDIMESPISMDSLNSSDQIKVELRYFLQQIRIRFRNAGLLIVDIRLAGDHPVNIVRKGTFRNRKIKVIFNMTPPPKLFKSDKTVVTPPRTPRKVKPTSPEAEKEHSTPKRSNHSPLRVQPEPQIDHSQRWKLIKDTIASILMSKVQIGSKSNVKLAPTTKDVQKSYFLREVQVKSDQDNWASVTINNKRGRNLELVFIGTLRRQYEFSVDSFQIVLDSYLNFAGLTKNFECSSTFYPAVSILSLTGNLQQSFRELEKRQIVTTNPEEIHGGGLLRYCYLSSMNFRHLEKSQMCSRFFIDYKTIEKQSMEINYFLADYFGFESDLTAKFDFLMALEAVVERSTVCLMYHEQRQILSLIVEMAKQTLTDVLNAEGISTARPSTKDLMKAPTVEHHEVDMNNNEINMASLQIVSPSYRDIGCYTPSPTSGSIQYCYCPEAFSGSSSGQQLYARPIRSSPNAAVSPVIIDDGMGNSACYTYPYLIHPS